jgi:hypothetical protein
MHDEGTPRKHGVGMIRAMSQAEIEDRKLDATLSEFFDRKRMDFYEWVAQLIRREVAEQLSHNQSDTRSSRAKTANPIQGRFHKT